jgi:large subunit ribosomal protein L35
MPKVKTRRSAAKRFKASGSGKKIMRRQTNKKHLLQHKTSDRKRRLSHMAVVHERDAENVRLMLPYL